MIKNKYIIQNKILITQVFDTLNTILKNTTTIKNKFLKHENNNYIKHILFFFDIKNIEEDIDLNHFLLIKIFNFLNIIDNNDNLLLIKEQNDIISILNFFKNKNVIKNNILINEIFDYLIKIIIKLKNKINNKLILNFLKDNELLDKFSEYFINSRTIMKKTLSFENEGVILILKYLNLK